MSENKLLLSIWEGSFLSQQGQHSLPGLLVAGKAVPSKDQRHVESDRSDACR